MAVRCVLRLNNMMSSNSVASHVKRMLTGQGPIQMIDPRELHCCRSDRFHLRCSSSKPLLIETLVRLTLMRNASGDSKDQIPNPSDVWCAQNSNNGSRRTSREEAEQITFDYYKGLPRLTIPLPSRKERCRFTLKPISNTVGDLSAMVKAEDRGVDRVVISSKDGVRIASSNSIELLLEEEEFYITINDTCYKINVPPAIRKSFNKDDVQKLSDVRMIVSQLQETLNVRDYLVHREQELLSEREKLRLTLEPYEELLNQLKRKAKSQASLVPWVLLFGLCVECGVLARFTWWEYSWDIMEPVTYFVTVSHLIFAFGYCCVCKQEFNLRDVIERRALVALHNKARKRGFDINQYNALKIQQARVQAELERLDPVKYSVVLSAPPYLPARLGFASSADGSFQSEKPLHEIGRYIKVLLDKSKKLK